MVDYQPIAKMEIQNQSSGDDCSITLTVEDPIQNLTEETCRQHFLKEIIEDYDCNAENVSEIYKTSTQLEKNISFLWAAYMHRCDLLESLLATGAEICYSDRNGNTAISLAAFSMCSESLNGTKLEAGIDSTISFANCSKTIRFLIKNGADIPSAIKLVKQKEPLLHYAIRSNSIDYVRLCLMAGANCNTLCSRGLNAIQFSSYLGHAQCLRVLLESDQADVNIREKGGLTALLIAAYKGKHECLNLLLAKGADVSLTNSDGQTLNAIIRNMPDSLTRKFDEAITFFDNESYCRTVILDFDIMIGNSTNHDIYFLNQFVNEGDEGKAFLKHPLCSSFLYLKWQQIRKCYIARLVFCFIKILFLTLYVLTALAQNCYNESKNINETVAEQDLCNRHSIFGEDLLQNPFLIEIFWWLLFILIVLEMFRKILGLFLGRLSLWDFDNVCEWLLIISVFLISYIFTGRTHDWQNYVAAFAVLIGWTNMFLMVGQLPVLGIYVTMYKTVQLEFAKLFIAYSCVMIGFTVCYCVAFPSSPFFANPFIGLATLFAMMTGADVGILTNIESPVPVFTRINQLVVAILFVIFVTIILMNLLVGIAVGDIQELKENAELGKLVRQTEIIFDIETAVNKFTPWLRNSIRLQKKKLKVRPFDPKEKQLPQEFLKLVHNVAKQNYEANHKDQNSENLTEELKTLLYKIHKIDDKFNQNNK